MVLNFQLIGVFRILKYLNEMCIFGSVSTDPASNSNTVVLGCSVNPLASTHPADHAPNYNVIIFNTL